MPMEGQALPADFWPQMNLFVEVKDRPSRLEVTSDQHMELCWLSRPGLLLQVSSYPNSAQCWVCTEPPCRGSNPDTLRTRSRSLKSLDHEY